MENIRKYCLLLFLMCFVNILLGQTNSDYVHVWNATSKSYEKVKRKRPRTVKNKKSDLNTTVLANSSTNTRKIMPAHKLVWVFPTKQTKGHWARPMKGEIQNWKSQKITFLTPVSIIGYSRYPFYKVGKKTLTAPKRTLKLDKIHSKQENKLALNQSVVSKFTFNGPLPGNTNIHYAQKIKLDLISFSANQNHYLVTDTLFVPMKAPAKSSLVSLQRRNRAFIKIIANCIVYESPIQLATMNMNETDFVFSANKYLFKSPYQNLESFEIKPAPPFVKHEKSIIVHKDAFSELEKGLLNRLYVNAMKQTLNDLNATNDGWEKDKLFMLFQSYRINKVNTGVLSLDKKYEDLFNKVCNTFDKKYARNKYEKPRTLNDLKILVSGAVADLPKEKIKYYVLPTQASLLPVVNENTGNLDALGTITYNATNDVELELNLDAKLEFDLEDFIKSNNQLNKKGLNIEESYPSKFISIEPQPLKINGKTIGRIIPISDQIIKLEIQLPEGSKSLTQLFLKPIRFKMDYIFTSTNVKYSQLISLEIDPKLRKKLEIKEPLKSFTVFENSTLTDLVKVSSKLDPSLENEGALNYVEVLLEINFQNKTVLRGPYRFSSYGTLGSEVSIPFFKHSDEYHIKVNGLAFYENGERNIEPFKTTDKIIVLEEGIFK